MTKLLPLLLLTPIVILAAAETPPLTSLALPLAIIMLFVLINGLFVAAEFAIIGVRPTQMEQMAEAGDARAKRVHDVLESRRKLDQYIATAQLGVTAASLGLAMYGEPAIGHFVEPYLVRFGLSEATAARVSYFVALGFLTYLHIVIGEMVPKALALLDSSSVALSLSRPMHLIGALFHYPVLLLNAVGNGLLRIVGIPPAQGHERLLAPEELEMLVAESVEGGLIEAEEEEIIRNILDFSERTVGQVMTPRRKVQAVPLGIGRDELLQIVTESRHSRFPVYEGDPDHIVGILHLKDLARLTLRAGSFDLRLILRAAPAVPEDYKVEALLAAFKYQRLHMAVVRDEFGGLAGIVTLEDLVEEVVGEVRDEFDQEREPYVEVSPGVLEISGDYLLVDLEEDVYLGEEEELPDVETVGGLIVSLLGRPPQEGDVVALNDNVRLTVLEVDRLAVARVCVEFATPGAPEAEPDKPD